ncbi:RagB/SusD family nutrient uptake outer membrane protein [Gaoshiqia sp. Z1-71]|uniref:RagB/SusD family nutrient uptake outer membrane protein n=1 Tax=Gaoshiqia hydrogeniformans TaxID=3290090 RepID=UPI003BF86268
MKKLTIILLVLGLVGLSSCEDMFLEKPDTTGTVDLNEVYSSSKNAEAALWSCYRNVLLHGWPGGWGVGHGALASISGERSRGYSWHGTYNIAATGLSVNGTDGSDGGSDHYGNNWSYIRACSLVKENIDMVPDMTSEMKGYIKAEATGLIAYRYIGMFYRYGGLPIVRKSFQATDDLKIGRSSLQETLDYIIELCDEAYNGLPAGNWAAAQTGRLTRGAVLAMKARALMFAARPLFNSSTPYLTNGSDNNLVCFGNQDATRWQEAITANEAVLSWAGANGYALINTGGAPAGQPNPNALDDYGKATSTPANQEVLLAYKCNTSNQYEWPASAIFYYLNTSPNWTNNRWDTDLVGLLTNFLEIYYKNDGNNQEWPQIGESTPRGASDWLEKIPQMEARCLADNILPGFDAFNNPGVYNYSAQGWGRTCMNSGKETSFPNAIGSGRGCGFPVKFYYHAESRVWFEPPLFRLAETYLNLAEAYNETGNSVKALENLNKVHNRAGLPAVTETGKDKLREVIQREKAIEFYNENHRYYDVKHWKHKDIANGIIGGQMRELQFKIKASASGSNNLAVNLESYWDAVSYTAFWSPRMYLEPIPQSEVNKGISVQNPGY